MNPHMQTTPITYNVSLNTYTYTPVVRECTHAHARTAHAHCVDRVGHLKAMAEKGPSPPPSPDSFRVVREEIPLSRRESEEIIARRLGEGSSSSRSAAPVPKQRPLRRSKVWSVLSFPRRSVVIEIKDQVKRTAS